MWPSLRLDFSRVPYNRLAESLSPMIPGGVLVLGSVLTNCRITLRFLSIPGLGYYAKLTILVFAAYVSGFVLTAILTMCGWSLGHLIGRALAVGSDRPQPWKDRVWRRVAVTLIGEDLAPAVEQAPSEPQFAEALRQVETVADPVEKMQRAVEIMDRHVQSIEADFDWFRWYCVLTNYLPKSTEAGPARAMNMLLETAVAGILVLVIGHVKTPFLWVISLLSIFLPIVWLPLYFVSRQWDEAYRQAASILRQRRESRPPHL